VIRTAALLALTLAWVATPVAHHSFASFYFEQQMITVTGEVIEFDYRAPHAWVRIKGRGDTGEDQVFAAEWSNPNRLARDGISTATLNVGDLVIISGSPGRNPEEHRLHLKTIQRPADGWKWPANRRR
jgi:hypothetical protein